MSGGKFNLNILRDYFLKTSNSTTPLQDKKKDEIVNMAILSVFDTKGVTVKAPGYSYEKPDGIIDQAEFDAVTEKQYKKAVKDIQKVLKKEMGNDFSNLKIPTYQEMSKMIADGKIDVDELSGKTPVNKPKTAEESELNKSRYIKIPEKAASGELTAEEVGEWISENMNKRDVLDIFFKVKNGTYNYKPSQTVAKTAEEGQAFVDAFTQNDDAPAAIQMKGKDGYVYNSANQVIRRSNGISEVYESYKYDGNSKDYSEMMQYKQNGYKYMYFRRQSVPDEKGKMSERVIGYALDENENIYKIHGFGTKDFDDFNKNNEYERAISYFREAGWSDEDIEENLKNAIEQEEFFD